MENSIFPLGALRADNHRLHGGLIAAPIFFLPFSRSSELAIAILALLGIYLFTKNCRHLLKEPSQKLFLLLFVAVWLPCLLSLPDSVNFGKTLKVVLTHTRFYFAGIYIIWALNNGKTGRFVHTSVAIIVAFWIIDALWQYTTGTNLLGFPLRPGRLNGVFGDDLKLGIFLSALLPYAIFHLHKRLGMVAAASIPVLGIIVILLAESRSAWIICSVALLCFFAYSWQKDSKTTLKLSSFGVMLILAFCAIIYSTSPSFSQRVDQTIKLFDGSEKSIDQASSYRLPIWKTAITMSSENPINGVGTRAFRYAFEDFATKDNYYIANNATPTHPHQMILEIGAENGAFGVAGILFFYFTLIRSIKPTFPGSALAVPAAISAIAISFPLNTHLALFSSAWGMFFWWTIAIFSSHRSTEKNPHHELPQATESGLKQ